jgi:hypothetical protein
MMGDRLGEQVVEPAVIAALGSRLVDREQRLDLGPADRLMLDRGRRQDARAPGSVVGIERTGEMDTALGGRAFSAWAAVLRQDGDNTPLRASAVLVLGVDIVGAFNSYLRPAFPCGRKRVVNDSELGFRDF